MPFSKKASNLVVLYLAIFLLSSQVSLAQSNEYCEYSDSEVDLELSTEEDGCTDYIVFWQIRAIVEGRDYVTGVAKSALLCDVCSRISSFELEEVACSVVCRAQNCSEFDLTQLSAGQCTEPQCYVSVTSGGFEYLTCQSSNAVSFECDCSR